MLLYCRNDREFITQYINAFRDAFTIQDTRYDNGLFVHQYGMKDFSTTITTNLHGTYGGVCVIPEETLDDPDMNPIPSFNKDAHVVYSRDPMPMPSTEDVLFLTNYIMTGGFHAGALHHVRGRVTFGGMFIYSQGSRIFIAPPSGKRYLLIGPGGDSIGEVKLSGIKVSPEAKNVRSFSLNGQTVELKDPPLFRRYATLGGGRVYRILKALYMNESRVGSIYSLSESWVGGRSILNLGGKYIGSRTRLFALVNDTHIGLLGPLFAFYHVKQFGRAIMEQRAGLSSSPGPGPI